MRQIGEIIHVFTRPAILFWALPGLMALLVAGTLAQHEMGLYEAERLYFASLFVWVGPIPLPGMYSFLALIAAALTTKLILKSPWHKANAGILITHLGALLMLFGGLLTAFTGEEGFLALREGEQGNLVTDYHARELAIVKAGKVLLRLPQEALHKGQQIVDPSLPFTITIAETCRNCLPKPQEGESKNRFGLASKVTIEPVALEKEDEANLFGALLDIKGAGVAADGEYLAFEMVPRPARVEIEGESYEIAARKIARTLPFTVQLNHFRKITYPGTDTAREYESEVTLIDGQRHWDAAIRMNEPLRYRGYTLYQSSFLQTEAGEVSVLAVVKNAGRVFPYLAGITLCLGLIIHLLLRRSRLPRQSGHAS